MWIILLAVGGTFIYLCVGLFLVKKEGLRHPLDMDDFQIVVWIIGSPLAIVCYKFACLFRFGVRGLITTIHCCIRSLFKVTTFFSPFTEQKAPELKPEKEASIESSKAALEALASQMIEENKEWWLKKQAEAEARRKELDSRPDAKILQFPRIHGGVP